MQHFNNKILSMFEKGKERRRDKGEGREENEEKKKEEGEM